MADGGHITEGEVATAARKAPILTPKKFPRRPQWMAFPSPMFLTSREMDKEKVMMMKESRTALQVLSVTALAPRQATGYLKGAWFPRSVSQTHQSWTSSHFVW